MAREGRIRVTNPDGGVIDVKRKVGDDDLEGLASTSPGPTLLDGSGGLGLAGGNAGVVALGNGTSGVAGTGGSTSERMGNCQLGTASNVQSKEPTHPLAAAGAAAGAGAAGAVARPAPPTRPPPRRRPALGLAAIIWNRSGGEGRSGKGVDGHAGKRAVWMGGRKVVRRGRWGKRGCMQGQRTNVIKGHVNVHREESWLGFVVG